jgi:peptide deformylase
LLKTVKGKYGAVGLAAPQIGVPLSAFVMELPESLKKYFSNEIWKAREMKPIPFTVSLLLWL